MKPTAIICGTCTWWKVHDDGERIRPLHPGTCLLTEVRDGDAPVHPTSKATAEDWEGYHAILLTAHDFSCNQHELKDDAS